LFTCFGHREIEGALGGLAAGQRPTEAYTSRTQSFYAVELRDNARISNNFDTIVCGPRTQTAAVLYLNSGFDSRANLMQKRMHGQKLHINYARSIFWITTTVNPYPFLQAILHLNNVFLNRAFRG
jgi:hypothetical protein